VPAPPKANARTAYSGILNLIAGEKYFLAREVEQSSGNRGQWQDFVNASQFDGLLRHSKDHAGNLVLGDSHGTGVLHLQHSVRAIVAHSGEDDANGIPSGIASGRAEKYID